MAIGDLPIRKINEINDMIDILKKIEETDIKVSYTINDSKSSITVEFDIPPNNSVIRLQEGRYVSDYYNTMKGFSLLVERLKTNKNAMEY